MGLYVNPKNCSKETWLTENGVLIPFSSPIWGEDFRPETHLPVCLIDNGTFRAAGIMFDATEHGRWLNEETGRPKIWFLVPREKLLEVCPRLNEYLEELQ